MKFAALAAIAVALLWALGSIRGLVDERRERRAEAARSVADSLAGAQTLLGPALQRECHETWKKTEGEGKDRKVSVEQRAFRQTLWPHRLDITTTVTLERHARGLFTVNGYVGLSTLVVDWQDTALPIADATLADAAIHCDPATLDIVPSDLRGVRSARIVAGGRELPLRPGRSTKANRVGFEGVLPDDMARGGALHAEITVTTVGTGSIAWVPVGDETKVRIVADWPHPAFAGDFLPVAREVDARGFDARWQVSGLATSARQALDDGAASCPLDDDEGDGQRKSTTKRGCAERFGVRFIDPVDGYVLTDRAIKYGVLFIALTFVGVGLVELMRYRGSRQRRVHPMQYLLVGCALSIFFLLLVAVSEHAGFAVAYLVASAACTTLLTMYGIAMLDGVRPGLAFGTAIALLYAVLYALLQLEQTALLLGSLLLFAVLAAVMLVTRRFDWYALLGRASVV